jgi:hypothetical protein
VRELVDGPTEKEDGDRVVAQRTVPSSAAGARVLDGLRLLLEVGLSGEVTDPSSGRREGRGKWGQRCRGRACTTK